MNDPLAYWLNSPGDRDSIPRCVIPKTQEMELDASLLNTQPYKLNGVIQKKRNTTFHYTSRS